MEKQKKLKEILGESCSIEEVRETGMYYGLNVATTDLNFIEYKESNDSNVLIIGTSKVSI